MLAKIWKFAGFLAATGLTALAIFLRYDNRYYRNRTGVKSVAVDFEVFGIPYAHVYCICISHIVYCK